MGEPKRNPFKDTIVIGFAMFAIFFGAGNLIFPPYMGMQAGKEWFIGFICFILADAGLAILTVLAMMRGEGNVLFLFHRLGDKAANLITVIAMICVGPLLCIPRTCATTFEMGVLPLFPEFNSWVFALLFFGLVYLLTVRPSKVVDIIGQYLTPILLLTLVFLFIKGMLTPIGPMRADAIVNVAKEGFLAGYQTMDVLGGLAITMVVVNTVREKGYVGKKEEFSIVAKASMVAALGLFVVYGGLTYLGATTSLMELGDINQTGLVVLITELLLKKAGVILLAVIVLFACLTTAIGLVSSGAEYFGNLLKDKFSYAQMVAVMCLCGLVISNFGITLIINLATPILNIIYPILVGQILLSFFNEKIKNSNIFKGVAIGTLLVCILGVANDFGASFDFIYSLPLAPIGFFWILPAVIGGAIGAFIPEKK